MILCTIPGSSPYSDFGDYGCYCGYGGSGTPVDELDRCCETHDSCYFQSRSHHDCTSFFDKPYFKTYSYTCNEGNLTCNDDNDECGAFICNCDRTAAICFAAAPYNKQYKDLDTSKYCQ
ncbi:phospholipase A2 GL16-1-like [Erythrolamprus reginae]|uniref:phospholipase A2 GL16-1-like n=1 Tax=Erythrolamprus reginae TaxID=121349 RepID=UPI00396C7C21